MLNVSEPSGPSIPSAESKGPPATTPGRPSRLRWLLLTLLLALIGWAIVCFDWNLFKGYAERKASAATGREFHIDGDLHVDLSMHPLITMNGLRLGNVPGAQEPTMASAQQLQMRVGLWSWLRGQTIVQELRLIKPTVLLEKDAKGNDNWTFPGTGTHPIIQQLTIDQGVINFREPSMRTAFDVDVHTDKPDPTSRLAPILMQGKGTYRNNPFALQGRVDSPLALTDAGKPYRIDVGASAGPTHAHASGALRDPLQLRGFDLDFTLAGPDLALLYRLIGVATPETPPYRLRGRLGHIGHVWTFDRFSGVVGGSDLGGDLTVDSTGKTNFLKAVLVSRHLDIHDLAGFVGAPSHANPAVASTAKQQVEAEQANASGRLLPNRRYDLERMRGMDADVSLRAQRVVAPKLPLDSMLAHLYIKDGVVRLDPLNFGAADGRIESQIRLDASRPVIAAAAKVKLRKLDLGLLLPAVKMTRSGIGRIGADIDLKGNGNSVAQMLATSDGRVTMGMGEGQISDLLMAYAGLNIAEILKLKITGDHNIAIRCAIGDFGARQGIWTVDAFVFDTADTVIRGSGNIDLRQEQFDILFKARPKERSLLSVRSPLHMQGSFTHPSVRPDIKALGLRGIVVATLSAVAPPVAELGLIEYGGGKDSDCLKPVLAK
jgi:uncharacterized protein involved in outer membrane biogenesis